MTREIPQSENVIRDRQIPLPQQDAERNELLLQRGWSALPESYRFPAHTPSLAEAQAWCQQLAESHYENFHVATWFLPKALRPHFHAIYAYCRVSDDMGDEVFDPDQSLALLDLWGSELDACYEGRTRHPVFVALAETIRECSIPKEPFANLLVAFRQDQTMNRFATMEDVPGLLPQLGKPRRPTGPLCLWRARRRECPPLRRNLHRPPVGQLLAGRKPRLRQGTHLYPAKRYGVLRRRRGVLRR